MKTLGLVMAGLIAFFAVQAVAESASVGVFGLAVGLVLFGGVVVGAFLFVKWLVS